jgi:hypothetical protein
MAEEQKKEKSRGFSAFGIPIGATLAYKKDPSVTVKTLDDRNKVEYQGKPFSISTLAKQLVGSPVSGYLYFKYGGRIIKSLAKPEAKSAGPDPAAPAVPSGAETAEAFDAAGEAALERSIDPLAGMEAGDSAESAAGRSDEEAE